MPFLPILGAKGIRIIFSIMVKSCRKMNKRLCIKNNLSHKINILVHPIFRMINDIIRVYLLSEALSHSISLRFIVEYIYYKIILIVRIILKFPFIARPVPILFDQIEIDDIRTCFICLSHNLFHSIEFQPIIRIRKKDIFTFSIFQTCLSSRRKPLVLLIDNDYTGFQMGKPVIYHLLQYLHRPVFSPIIDKDKLHILICLSQS